MVGEPTKVPGVLIRKGQLFFLKLLKCIGLSMGSNRGARSVHLQIGGSNRQKIGPPVEFRGYSVLRCNTCGQFFSKPGMEMAWKPVFVGAPG